MNESDIFLDIFSKEEGKLTVVAKGVRKKGSKLCGILQPFFIVSYERLSAKEHSIPRLIRASILQKPSNNFHTLSLYSVAAEVSKYFLQEHHPLPIIFHIWTELLDIKNISHVTLIAFLCRFLTILGIFPTFKNCHACEKSLTESDKNFAFHPSEGIFHLSCAPLEYTLVSFPLLKTLAFASTAPLQNTVRILLSQEDTDLLFTILFSFITSHTCKPLKSITVWENSRPAF